MATPVKYGDEVEGPQVIDVRLVRERGGTWRVTGDDVVQRIGEIADLSGFSTPADALSALGRLTRLLHMVAK